MASLLQDLRYALRSMMKNPGFTAVATITLALGIGANTAIFSTVNAVILRPLPFEDPDRLVRAYSDRHGELWTSSPPDFVDYRRENHVFHDLAAFYSDDAALGGDEGATLHTAGVVSSGLFPILGVQPALGRTFTPDDEVIGQEHVVLISHGLWERRFASDTELLGRSITLDGEPYSVIGVMPERFAFPADAELWVPLAFTTRDLTTQRGAHYLTVVGRLLPDVSVEAAEADMIAIAARLEEQYPETNLAWSARVQPLHESIVGDVRPAFLILLGAVGLVLLIACANVANLFLARAVGRERELAIRIALGGSRFRVFRGLMTESVVLGIVGGLMGLLVATWGTSFLVALAPADIPRIEGVTTDATVLGFALGISVLTGLLFGFIPAIRASLKADLTVQLKAGGRGMVGDYSGARTRSILVVAEIALAVLLVAGSGLLIKSFLHLQRVDPGFNPAGVLTFTLSLPDARYPNPNDADAFYTQLLTQIRGLPGVESSGGIFGLPMSGFGYSISTSTLDGRRLEPAEEDRLSVQVRAVTPDYFETLGVALLRGRHITDADRAGAPPVVVVSESAARLLWSDVDPVGHHFTVGTGLGIGRGNVGGEVVGLVADIKDNGLVQNPRPKIYVAHPQFPTGFMSIAVRSSIQPSSLIEPIRRLVASRDPQLPMFQVMTMDQLVAGSVAQRRFYMLLLTLFGATALVLAAVGVYGVMSYSVAQRTSEIGIRIALGAGPAEVVRYFLERGFSMAVMGVVLGIVASFLSTRLLAGLLFGIQATDPTTFVAVSAILLSVAIFACFVPARRATRVDPIVALKHE